MNTAEQSCGAFLDALASKAPVPGGGGASALAGALGAALCTMAVSYTHLPQAAVPDAGRSEGTGADETRHAS